MAKYTKQISIDGSWVKAADLRTGMKAKIITETIPTPSQFKDKNGNQKNQDLCKVKFEGFNDAFNVALNRATVNALIDAFGDDSVNWQNQVLTVETERVRVGGRAVVALYLVPQGYKKIDDENGYAIIVKATKATAKSEVKDSDIPVIDPETDKVNAELAGQDPDESSVDLSQIPF